jgi:hypothetical protein
MSKTSPGRADTNPSETYWAMTVKNSPTILSNILDIFMDEINPINTVANMTPAIVFQPLTNDMISRFSKNGGNALGITTADGPLICVYLRINAPLVHSANPIRRSDQHRHFLVLSR